MLKKHQFFYKNNVLKCEECESLTKADERNYLIVFVRVLAMLMIVLCHISTYMGTTALGLVLDVGVQIFLFLSGWLYSEKKIDSSFKWLQNRWKKLCIPAYIWSFIMLAIKCLSVFQKEEIWKYVLTHLLNLQGWTKILPLFTPSWIKSIMGCGHMWFLTSLMVCYLSMLFLKELETEIKLNYSLLGIVLYIVVGALLLCVFALMGICIEWIYIFFLGYLLKRVWKEITAKKYTILTILMCVAMCIRVMGKVYLDGTIYYEGMIVYLTHNILGIWIIATIEFVYKRTDLLYNLAKHSVVQWFDKYSYEIFLVHFGIIQLIGMYGSGKQYIDLTFFSLLTIFSAIALKRICTVRI